MKGGFEREPSGATADEIWPRPTWHLACLAGAALLLVWPAFWNGYPLVFADTGTYLGQALLVYLGWDRPPFYSVFLMATDWRLTLWLPVFAQGLILAHLLSVTLRCLGRPEGRWLLLAAALLALLTGLPWVAAQLIPDVFTGVVVLSLWLLGFRAATLSALERLWFLLLATGAVAMHQSHLPLVFGLAILGGALLWSRWGWRLALAGTARMAGPALLAGLAMIAVNLAGHGRASVSPFGSVFLAARLIYDGPGMAMLRHTCPEAGWRICPVLDRLGPHHNAFLWDPRSPLHNELGGPKAWSPEASAIIAATIRAAPAEVAAHMLGNGLRQFWLIDTGDGLEAWPGVPGPEPLIARFFPSDYQSFLSSRQQRGLLRQDAEFLAPLHRAVALLGVLALLGLLLFRRRVLGFPGAALAIFVLAAALGNAMITGALSGPAERYQARLAWLFAFTPAVLLTMPRARPAPDIPPISQPALD
ncbi:MAG: hypothetical protein IRY87_35565, partial [Acetobacteraceae bacterium]|nr:hypothetical protein [Acetobacteraceae bacterium]